MTAASRIATAGTSGSKADDLSVAGLLFDGIAAQTADIEGVSRPAFSAIETMTLDMLEEFARSQGIEVWYDAGQNANFSLPEHKDATSFALVGSHVDSVPFGGNFDGLAGVIAGLVCLVRARRDGAGSVRPFHVLAMRGEESAWFGPCYIGSKALTGSLPTGEIEATHKGDGRSLGQHMADIGIPMDDVRAGLPLIDLKPVSAYLELHIEQGPLLVGKNIPAAVVSGIRGNFRHRSIRCVGEAGHSGAVPRAFRRDPVLALADLLVRLDESWSTILNKGDDLVLTSGVVGTDPSKHAMSRIPDEIAFSLDIRSQSARTLDEMRALLAAEMKQVSRDRKVSFVLDEEIRTAPALCDPVLVDQLLAAMERTGQDKFLMPSGGGHDAAVFSAAGVPSAMVFVRNRNGSHNPDEAMDLTDFMAGTDILYEFLKAAH